MASGIAPPSESLAASGVFPRPAEQEAYISGRLEETRRHVRAVDLTVALLMLAIGVLAYLLVVAVLDHWVVAEGLGRGGRTALWAVLVAAAGFYVARWVLPPLLHRVNPIFAAYTIEQTRPTFKNGLINFLLLRRHREEIEHNELDRRVFQGLQLRTAAELAQVTTGTTVDRLHVIRLGYTLASLVTICCLYLVLSPKNPLVSFGRVILPWARIGAPTRVAIDAVAPGDCAAYQGDPVMVSAEIHGLRPNEEVKLFYSSADDQLVDQSVPMSVPQGGFRYQGELPPGSLGLQQSLLYRIAAGDGASPTFRIDMQIPPTILVDRVEYEYPEYTGLKRRVDVDKGGDLLANEGTRVTIHATADHPIAQAHVELEGDARHSIRMTASGTAASGRLTLAMNPGDQAQPQYRWYQLRFTDPERRENRRPIRYRIDVIPDLRPEIQFVDPPPDEFALAVNGSVQLKVRAKDPDFGLRRVAIRAEREGRGLLIPLLLDKPRSFKPHEGPFEASYRFEPAGLGLKPGDTIAYWGEAADCKEKEEDKGASANVAETERRTMVIVAADPQQPPAKKPSQGGTAKKPQAGEPKAAPPDKPDQGPEERPDGQPDGQKSEPQKPGKEPNKKESQPKGSQPKDKGSASPDDPEDKQPGDQGPANSDSSGGEAGSPQGQKPDGKGEKSDGKQPKSRNGKPGESSPDGSDEGEPNTEEGNPAENAAGKKGGSGGKNQKPSGPVDGQTDPGEAIRRMLDDRQEKRGAKPSPADGKTESKPGQEPSGQKPQAGQQPDNQPTPGSETAEGEKKPGDSADKAGKMPDAKGPDSKGEKPKGAESKGADSKSPSGEKTGAEPTKSGQPAGGEDRQPTDGQKGDGEKKGPAGEKRPASQKPDANPSAEQAPAGEKTAKKGKQGEPSGGEPMKAGEKSPAAAENSEPGPSKDGDGSKKGDDTKKGASASDKGKAGGEKDKTGSEEKSGEPSGAGEKKGEPGSGDNRKTDDGSKSDTRKSGEAAPKSSSTGEDAKTAQSMPGAEEKKGEGTGKQEKGPKAGEPKPHQEAGGAGKPADEKMASPSPQDATQPRGQEQGDAAAKKSEGDQTPPSPSSIPKPSKSKGEADGDRNGGGKSAGGQQTPQPGQGPPGSQTAADDGDQKSGEPGDGDAGTKAGGQMKTDQKTGEESPKGEGSGAGSRKKAGGPQSAKEPQKSGETPKQDSDSDKSGQPGAEPSAGKNPGEKDGSNAGNPMQGGSAGKDGPESAGPPPPPPSPDNPNLEYSRKQTTLALEHLADQLAKEKSDLLPKLGWDKRQAEEFLRQWEEMRKAAAQPGPQGDAAKRELDKALQSLGLRPPKSTVRAGQGSPDSLQRLQESGRFEPPAEWKDKVRAYNQGVGGSRD